jgi:serine/threonine protein kinase
VARVLDAEVEDDEAFVVTELIDGPTLEDDVAAHGPFAPDELRALAHGLADALHAIHRVGVVHRDLKPGNVMLSGAGPVIIDFGIAQVADDVRSPRRAWWRARRGTWTPRWSTARHPPRRATGGRGPPSSRSRPPGAAPSGRTLDGGDLPESRGQVDLEGVEPPVATALWAALQPRPANRLDPHSVLAVIDGRWGAADLEEALATLRCGGTTAPASCPRTPRSSLPPRPRRS